MSRRRRIPAARPVRAPRVVVGSVYGVAVVALAATAAWPIYREPAYALLVAVAALVGGVVAASSARLRWNGWVTTGALAAATVVLGVLLAVPSLLGSDLVAAVVEVGRGIVFGWKDLVTVELPVGTYRNLMVPALVVFLVGTAGLLMLAWRADRKAYAAVAVAIGMVAFGLVFGRAGVSAPLDLGPFVLYAPLETALGAATLIVSLLWLAWRTHDERLRALERAALSSGVRGGGATSAADRRRTALAALMVVVALGASVAVIPLAARGAERDVLRAAAGPEVDLAAAISPLASYRALFADESAGEVLFTVSADGALPERVRLATLDDYDGETFRSGGTTAASDARFVRVPSSLDAGGGPPVSVDIAIEGLDGIWMPTVGALESVEFDGARAAALADGFYYSAAASAGVQTAGSGLASGDAYTLRAVVSAPPDLAAVDAPGVDASVTPPDSLRQWVQTHASGTDGAALAGLVTLLRERGYLSHGLTESDTVWTEALPGYRFQPAVAGHSLARIDQMFTRLLERENDPRAVAGDNFVAAVGDDEQFAVAVALIAQELGFPSRVVVGARLGAAPEGLSACEQGVCRAQDLSAWTEVQTAAGAWVPIDVTPQYEQSPSLEVTELRDPEIVTEVRPEAVEEVVPPDPLQEDTGSDQASDDGGGIDLAWLWPVLRVAGIVLAVAAIAFGPLLAIVAAKNVRRRSRRTQGRPAARIAAGWDEYVDAAVDAGREVPTWSTRSELASTFATPRAGALALDADRAAFSGSAASDDDAAAFWRIVDEERRRFAAEDGGWRVILATVSLKSFIRHLAPRSATAERGRRRTRRR
ncbi:transglutaminase-like domain-containing protein [Microbacterium awajiense]|uniref:Transglutaminase-like domain-containing protein n=1 Tax=Microbacterium awajiense TaxID=415214 RepID=A0ABP7AJR5_9MICO